MQNRVTFFVNGNQDFIIELVIEQYFAVTIVWSELMIKNSLDTRLSILYLKSVTIGKKPPISLNSCNFFNDLVNSEHFHVSFLVTFNEIFSLLSLFSFCCINYYYETRMVWSYFAEVPIKYRDSYKSEHRSVSKFRAKQSEIGHLPKTCSNTCCNSCSCI